MASVFFTNAAENLFNGNTADAVYYGLDGDDSLKFNYDNSLSTTMEGGNGNDTLRSSKAADFLYGGNGNDDVDGMEGDDHVYGGDGNDLLKGDHEGETWLGSGSDSVYGGAGNDTISGGGGLADLLSGDDGDDTIFGDNTFSGLLSTTGGSDKIYGGAGNDLLHGQTGNDVLFGGEGADQFFFDTAPNKLTNSDKVKDFSSDDGDKIVLSQAVFTDIGPGLSGNEFYLGGRAHDGSDRIMYKESNGKLFFDHDGAGGDGKVLFATLAKHLDLSNADFVMIA